MITLQEIKKNPELVDMLAWPYDFDIEVDKLDKSWLQLDLDIGFDVIAREGSGGLYLAYGNMKIEERPILYVSSEGQAGKIAQNLTELISMIITVPYWQDLLKFSGNGNLEEMIKTESFMKKEYAEDYPGIEKAQKEIAHQLNLNLLEKTIDYLHSSINSTDINVVADDGWKYETLFNSFKSSDNPTWNKKKA